MYDEIIKIPDPSLVIDGFLTSIMVAIVFIIAILMIVEAISTIKECKVYKNNESKRK